MSATPPADRSRWIPWVFAGAMLGVVAVNGVMVAAAVSTFTGTTTGRAYDRGRTYNHVLEEAARQQALGWSTSIAWSDGAVLLEARDRDGAALPPDTRVTGTLERPLERTALPLAWQAIGEGRWIAPVALPEPGQWQARLTLTRDGARFEASQRLVLR